MEPFERVLGSCFYLAIPLTGSESEVREWLDTASFIEKVVDQVFAEGLSIMDIHDLIQSETALDSDAYLEEVEQNLEDLEQCLILMP